ncbi:TIGR03943 family putative permease subunit [Alkaliphilus transvaalensis]|uniref:TIGR03943 family putative permease subunit n=1 Tax=Alkaliphilus transvaalensis TaxID=114628 RepID=UPI00047CFE17|nr:TIGR03943 family protein [Alkaliphilus transvaalensis]
MKLMGRITSLIQTVILISFSYFIYSLIKDNTILYYIHPRMVPALYFTIIILVILAFNEISKLLKPTPSSRGIKLFHLIFLITLFVGFFSEHRPIDYHSIELRGINYRGIESEKTPIDKEEDFIIPIINSKVSLGAESYIENLTNIIYNFSYFHGAEIEVEGFIYRKDHYDVNQFAIARVAIQCCAADAEILGLLSHWEYGNELPENTWVRITGNLQSFQYFDETLKREIATPIIIVEELEEIDEPANPYVYQ